MSVPFEREAPPVITQTSATRCWAAALESWMQAQQLPITLTQERLVQIFRTVPGLCNAARTVPRQRSAPVCWYISPG